MDAGLEYVFLLLWVIGMVRVSLPPAVRETHPSPQDDEGETGSDKQP